MNRYKAGTGVTVEYTLSPLVDAAEVVVTYALRDDNGHMGPSTIRRLSLGQVTRVGVGVYEVVIDTTGMVGTCVHQMVATGGVLAAADDAFYVEALPLAA